MCKEVYCEISVQNFYVQTNNYFLNLMMQSGQY